MRAIYIEILNFFAIVVALSCFAFCVFLGIGAFILSQETGAGAAQGDLGFFMILSMVTPFVLIAIGLSFILGYILRPWNNALKSFGFIFGLCGLALLILAWDWFFLLEVWRV